MGEMPLLSRKKSLHALVGDKRATPNLSFGTGPSSEREYSAVDPRLGFVSLGHIGFLAGMALFTAAVVGGSGYVIQELHRQVGIACEVTGLPTPVPVVKITTEMLHVTSIALGHVPVAVINGAVATEGDSLTMETPNGSATLHVMRIRDGVVQFKYGDQTISINLEEAPPRKGSDK
jgi:hypothetical protein